MRARLVSPFPHDPPPLTDRVGDALARLWHRNSTWHMVNVPGEAVIGAVQIWSADASAGVTVALSELAGPAGSIPASAADLRLVKHWWRPLVAWEDWRRGGNFKDALVPDLLVHDDDLIEVDADERTVTVAGVERTTKEVDDSYVRPSFEDEQVVDASDLQAFSIPAGGTRTVLFDIRIPAAAAPGPYSGTLTIALDGTSVVALQVVVRVLDVDLVPSGAAIYFTQRVTDAAATEATTAPGNGQVTVARLRAMLEDCAAAGVNPNCYAPFGEAGSATRELFEAHLQARNDAGLGGLPLYYLGAPSVFNGSFTRDASGKAQIQAHVEDVLSVCANYGITEVYFYGTDEDPEALDLDAPLFEGVHAGGGKTFVSIADGSFDALTDKTMLDLVVSHSSTPTEIAKWSGAGIEVHKYASPQAGAACPNLYRRNMGLGAWAIGASWPHTWAYCYLRGDMWNGFDSAQYTEEAMVYPLYNNQILPTWRWLGYREGIYDLRFVKTLEAAIDSSSAPMAAKAQAYLDGLRERLQAEYPSAAAPDYNGWTETAIDLDVERGRIIGYIEALA